MAKKNKENLIIVATIVIAILVIFLVIILWVQRGMFFYPWHDETSYNMLKEFNDFKEINIENYGEVLHGWLKINSNLEEAPLVIFYGGNAQNTSNTCMYFSSYDIFSYFENYNFLTVDYPEYGLSTGKINAENMLNMGLKVYDYAKTIDGIDEKNIIICGYSIGTGIASYVASQKDVNGLILISPYDDTLNLYNNVLNIFYGPVENLARYRFESIKYAENITVKPLIITSKTDEVINYNLSINLSEKFIEKEDVIILENINHAGYFSDETVLKSIQKYLSEKL